MVIVCSKFAVVCSTLKSVGNHLSTPELIRCIVPQRPLVTADLCSLGPLEPGFTVEALMVVSHRAALEVKDCLARTLEVEGCSSADLN